MRGVYRTAIRKGLRRGGSSPHARGLRRVCPRVGVRWGSSPHARGLRAPARTPAPSTRIIPACAGFTRPARRPEPGHSDHPRMRGVYAATARVTATAGGSSPHARGLLVNENWWIGRERIIPARAGFTGRRADRLPLARDHPRTRGVYRGATPLASLAVGSSPHARGLPVTAGFRGLLCGIIPARAGFTALSSAPVCVSGDHPRTRGVYGDPAGRVRPHQGSSPHARGLLKEAGYRLESTRIIPARAGFTPCQPPSMSRHPDHPRTRGVYLATQLPVIGGLGSSPHARGLPIGELIGLASAGIIPARAGFTAL